MVGADITHIVHRVQPRAEGLGRQGKIGGDAVDVGTVLQACTYLRQVVEVHDLHTHP